MIDISSSLEIMDTTLRDGEQTHNVAFSTKEKLHIARLLLERVQVNRIEVASARTSEGEMETVKEICRWASNMGNNYIEKIEVLGFLDQGKSVDWIIEAKGKVLNLLAKGSLKHLHNQLKKQAKDHFKDVQNIVEYAYKNKISVNVYLEDWSNGWQHDQQYIYDFIHFLSGIPIKRIMLPDTLGILYPIQVYHAVTDIKAKFPSIHFDFHPHNDYGLGTINVLEAVRAGVNGVHVTVNCLGERTGNASLAQVVAGLHDHLNMNININEKSLFSLSRVVESFSGKRLSANEPIVGEDVFTQTAGIHADGDKKGKLYQSALDPKRFGREHSYALGKLSGKASLEHNLEKLGIELSVHNRKIVLSKIIELGDQKKTVTIEDLPFIITDVLNLPPKKNVIIDNVVVTSGKGVLPHCSMAISYKGETNKVNGAGDGGYDAFMNALLEWSKIYNICLPSLENYEVRIPPGGQTSALVECKISWQYDGQFISTSGVSPDQVLAAISATEKMLNHLF